MPGHCEKDVVMTAEGCLRPGPPRNRSDIIVIVQILCLLV